MSANDNYKHKLEYMELSNLKTPCMIFKDTYVSGIKNLEVFHDCIPHLRHFSFDTRMTNLAEAGVKLITKAVPANISPGDRIFDTMKELIGVCSKTIEYSQFTKTGYRDKQFEQLCLFTGSVYIGSEAMQLFNPYGLRLLTLTEMHIDSDTLIYISARCESLSHVVMDRLTVLGTISANKGTLLIDMSSARLAELRFSHIRFIPPGEIDLLKPARLIASYPRTIDSDEHINQSSTRI
ncbi:hypothetical protein PHYBLDRAFT_144900 [Phycomyces blakesleeanus NRRL 1555(-)]|uniref:Uncharacterized protein n=1 Tax=Phycomyces blakesleeanus (strain ATCC 8743b / DSM 1359 / FGSC 10004 / NBRC 33097 / NRRL 1555) TaxID=763407 RepID=A0A163AM68_PHYB8|nr:hypothetical protein PHYBLDRAFT_144900 [Phycomyces blakesleeanus NRRL 1555(-)]OAD74451.1 hypothetical protein PHYBLDRAFT_144900 [Phycomyces blakesleeanus NRRL 1555(-)]|eukprot:XP_018292491.1 hypothetical protein PHYBLDRAFT_144900 [Phycomyces blakesleeanus NRRL 1555(-)]